MQFRPYATLLCLLGGLTGCASILGIDQDYVERSSDAGGANAGGGGPGAGGPGAGGPSGGGAQGGEGGTVPGMVNVGDFFIDATEVTQAAYDAFVMSQPPTTGQPAGCESNTSFSPSEPPPGGPDHPVTFVDWCDAHAYCAWMGRRLCGKVGGGSNPADQAGNLSSQWFFACAQGGSSDYSYGNSYSADTCVANGFDMEPGASATDKAQPAGSVESCVGESPPFDVLFDMSGNVYEWEDGCDGELCNVRGGSYRSGAADTFCSTAAPINRTNDTSVDVGFRCCLDG